METSQLLNDGPSFVSLLNLSKVLWLSFGFASLWLLAQAVSLLARNITEYLPSRRFLILQINTLANFLVYLGGTALLFINVINPPKELLIAAAGSAAVALGFALKDIAASVIAGLVLLFDSPFKVGDRISFDDTYGEIIAIGLRSVRLCTLDDNIVTIPNSRFINDVVASGNFGELDMMVVCDFHIHLNNDMDKAKDIIHEVIVTSRFAYLKKPVTFAINEIILHDKLAMQIKAKAYVMDVNYEKAFQSDVVTRVNSLFIEQGIARP